MNSSNSKYILMIPPIRNRFRVEWSVLSDNESAFCDSGKFKLVTILEKK